MKANDISTSKNHSIPVASWSKHTRKGTAAAEYRMKTRTPTSHFSFQVPSGMMASDVAHSCVQASICAFSCSFSASAAPLSSYSSWW